MHLLLMLTKNSPTQMIVPITRNKKIHASQITLKIFFEMIDIMCFSGADRQNDMKQKTQ